MVSAVARGDIQRLNAQRRKILTEAKLLSPSQLEAAWAALAADFARATGLVD